MRKYCLVANYKGRVSVIIDGLSFKDAYIIRTKHSYYPHLSYEVRVSLI